MKNHFDGSFLIAKEDCIMNKFKEFLASINWSEVKPHTVVSLILQIFSWINMGLLAVGKPVIDVHEDVINQIVGIAFVIVPSLYGDWKNHSFTWTAQFADEVAYALRDGRLTLEEAEEIKNKIGKKDVIVKVDKDLFEKELDDVAEGKESDDIVG
jgi:SPP1 family holin